MSRLRIESRLPRSRGLFARAALVIAALAALPAGTASASRMPLPDAPRPRPAFAVPAEPSVTVLDVGWGDAILLRDGARAVLVDTSGDPVVLRRALRRNGVSGLDAVLLTHLHRDHSTGVMTLRDFVPFSALYLPGVFGAITDFPTRSDVERATGLRARPIGQGDRLKVGRLDVQVLWPPKRGVARPQNAKSLVLLVTRSRSRMLLAADAESGVIEYLMRTRGLGRVDVLKVGHHGSTGAVSYRTLRGLVPACAVLSADKTANGLPTRSTLGILAARRIPVLRTDEVGDVTVRMTPTKAVVTAAATRPLVGQSVLSPLYSVR